MMQKCKVYLNILFIMYYTVCLFPLCPFSFILTATQIFTPSAAFSLLLLFILVFFANFVEDAEVVFNFAVLRGGVYNFGRHLNVGK